jgi:hypothetical protein
MRKQVSLSSKARWAFAAVMAIAPCSLALAQDNVSGTAATASGPQVQQTDSSGVNWKGVGIGAGTAAGNLLYVPAKLVYGLLGGIGGGAGYALTGGNQQVANTIWRSSLGGDYVLTPEMIKGEQPIHFSGPTQTAAPGLDSHSPSATANLPPTNSSVPPASVNPPTGYGAGSSAPPSYASSGTLSHNSSVISAPIDSGAGPIHQSLPSAPPAPRIKPPPAAPVGEPPAAPSGKSSGDTLPSTTIE